MLQYLSSNGYRTGMSAGQVSLTYSEDLMATLKAKQYYKTGNPRLQSVGVGLSTSGSMLSITYVFTL